MKHCLTLSNDGREVEFKLTSVLGCSHISPGISPISWDIPYCQFGFQSQLKRRISFFPFFYFFKVIIYHHDIIMIVIYWFLRCKESHLFNNCGWLGIWCTQCSLSFAPIIWARETSQHKGKASFWCGDAQQAMEHVARTVAWESYGSQKVRAQLVSYDHWLIQLFIQCRLSIYGMPGNIFARSDPWTTQSQADAEIATQRWEAWTLPWEWLSTNR